MAILSRAKIVAATMPPEEPESGKSGTPDETWTKAEIQEHLDENGVEWQTSMTKAQLLELV